MKQRNTPSTADLAEVAALTAAIRQRPSYRLLRAWLDMHQPGKTAKPRTSVGWFCSAIEHATGARIDEETAWVALEDAGFELRLVPGSAYRVKRDHPGADVNIDEAVILDIVRQRNEGALPQPRFVLWGDGAAGPM